MDQTQTSQNQYQFGFNYNTQNMNNQPLFYNDFNSGFNNMNNRMTPQTGQNNNMNMSTPGLNQVYQYNHLNSMPFNNNYMDGLNV